MTYNELKTRLSVVEKTLKKIQTSKDTKLSPSYIKETVTKLSTLKESIQNQLTLIKEEDGIVRTADPKEAEKLSKRGVSVDLVDKIQENEEDIEFDVNDMRVMITQVGKALGQALVKLGDELARLKAHRLETNSFDIHVEYKGEREGTDDEFAFHIENGNLHIADFSYNKKLVDIGVKPSGEAFVNVDVLKNEFMKHFKSLNEQLSPEDHLQIARSMLVKGEKDGDEDLKRRALADMETIRKKYNLNEAPYQTTYIKVKRRDYNKAIGIIDSNIDSVYVTTDIVDDDGDGNVIIYFNFRDTSDDLRPDFFDDPAAFIYDLTMDLKANDIEIMDHSHDLNSNLHNESNKNKVYEFVGKELEARNEPLYDKLVASSGKSETVEGEMLRAINRIAYRYYNDGDKYFEGYGAETAGPAHAFLMDANHPLKSAMDKIFNEPSGDEAYERMLKDALDMILDHIESRQGKYTPNNVGDIFDYDSYFEDEEEDDDYTYDYDDEEDDDYYNEEGLNEEDISKRKQAVKLIRQTLEKEGGASGLEPLVKAVKGLGFDKEGLLKLLRKTVKVEKHKHGDYILTPITEKKINEGTELYDKGGMQIKRFSGGKRGLMVQITVPSATGFGGDYIQVTPDQFATLAKAMQSVQGDLMDMSTQVPRRKNTDENTLKEFTDNRFEGADIIRMVAKHSPDMFGKQLFADLLPKGVASEDSAVKALHAHDKSGIKARMGQYAPMFVHVQYHNLKHEGEDYQMHQTQYYNSNFKDKDPDFNPSVSRITLIKDPEGEHETLGTILVKTEEYVQDLRNIPGLGKRFSEVVKEAKGGQIMPGDYVKNQHGNFYMRVDGKVGRHDAYVRVTNGKAGKRKTGLHDSFKLTLVNKKDLPGKEK